MKAYTMFFTLSKKESVFLFLSLIVFVSLLVGSIFSESRIFDEGLHVDAGYAFLTHKDFANEPFNPPLARELVAIPSLLNPATLHDPIFLQQRLVVVFISSLFFLTIYFFTRKLFGVYAACFAVLLYLFNPEILAHSHYAVTDLILTFFISLTFFLFILWKEKFTIKRIIILGLCIGSSLSAKVSAVPFLILSFFFLFLFDLYQRKKITYWFTRKKIIFAGLVCFSFSLTLWATYFFTFESAFGKGFIPHNTLVKKIITIPGVRYMLAEPIPLGGYIRTIKQVVLYNYSQKYSKQAFLTGVIYPQGVWYFYPIAFLLKTPLPLLILAILAKVYVRKKEQRYFFLPIMAIIFSAMMSTLNLGIRYILPVYPLLIVYISQLAMPSVLFSKKNVLLTLLLAWYVAGTLSIYPHFLSFLNEMTGRNKQKYHFLVDSNYDWGQGLVSLRSYQQMHQITNLQLAYFGMVDPHMYKLTYQRIQDISYGDKTTVQKIQIKKGSVVAISASCYWYCGYYKEKAFVLQQPNKIIGGSILLFNF